MKKTLISILSIVGLCCLAIVSFLAWNSTPTKAENQTFAARQARWKKVIEDETINPNEDETATKESK